MARRPGENIGSRMYVDREMAWGPAVISRSQLYHPEEQAADNEMARRPAVIGRSQLYQISRSRLQTIRWQVGQL